MPNFLGAPMILLCKKYISRFFVGPGFLASYWSAGLGTFLQVSALASYWLEVCANFYTSIKPIHFINEQVYFTSD
jgi:hypothetical protein